MRILYNREQLIQEYEDIMNILLKLMPDYGKKNLVTSLQYEGLDEERKKYLTHEKIEQYVLFLSTFNLIETYEVRDKPSDIYAFNLSSDILLFYTKHMEAIDRFFDGNLPDHERLEHALSVFKMDQGNHCPSCCDEKDKGKSLEDNQPFNLTIPGGL